MLLLTGQKLRKKVGSTSDGYGDTVGYSNSWVQGQSGTVTDDYRCNSLVQGQSGTEVGDGSRDNHIQRYREYQVQVVGQMGIATIG